MLLGRELQIYAKISNFQIFESAPYIKSGSMPLMDNHATLPITQMYTHFKINLLISNSDGSAVIKSV